MIPNANQASTLGYIGDGSGDWGDENRHRNPTRTYSTNEGTLAEYNLYTSSGSYYTGLQSWGWTGYIEIKAMWIQ